MTVVQINLQPHFGGGEVFTAFLCRALSALGVPTRLLVHPEADFWQRLPLPADTTLVSVPHCAAVADALREHAGWLIGHGPVPEPVIIAARAEGALITAIAHMPVQGRNPAVFAAHDRVFAVSGWVLEGLRNAGIPTWDTPLYGVADFGRVVPGSRILRRSCYDWDRRKFRDRLLGRLEPLVEPLRSHRAYDCRAGLTLGVVSRLTPIKQLPELFEILAPLLARTRAVNLELFGSGGYASVRDLKRALAPLAGRARFWGHQDDVGGVYRSIDYLMTGLPEKEALGLNVIEAQASGTPVLAPAAPPFTETVADGVTGFLYRDPREDAGRDFLRLIERLQNLPRRLDPRDAPQHLAKFSFDAFVERLRPVVAWAQASVGSLPIATSPEVDEQGDRQLHHAAH